MASWFVSALLNCDKAESERDRLSGWLRRRRLPFDQIQSGDFPEIFPVERDERHLIHDGGGRDHSVYRLRPGPAKGRDDLAETGGALIIKGQDEDAFEHQIEKRSSLWRERRISINPVFKLNPRHC